MQFVLCVVRDGIFPAKNINGHTSMYSSVLVFIHIWGEIKAGFECTLCLLEVAIRDPLCYHTCL